jgi:hypothetical protein
MNKFKILASCVLIMATLFSTGCSGYAELENKVRAGNDYKGDPGETAPEATIPADKSGFFNVGDTVLWEREQLDSDGKKNGIFDQKEYTVNSVKVCNSLEEANLTASDLNLYSNKLLSENGSLADGNKLILADVTVKNINVVNDIDGQAEDDMNITELRLDNAGGFGSWEIAYFSAHGDAGKAYSYYKLPVGETKNVKIGWIVGSDMFEFDFSDICLCVTYGGGVEYDKFIDLNLS